MILIRFIYPGRAGSMDRVKRRKVSRCRAEQAVFRAWIEGHQERHRFPNSICGNQ